jgi:hypothetical protein
MLPSYFVFISIVFSIWGNLSYTLQTLRGKTKPNRVTWFMWSLAPLIAFAGEVKGGIGLPSLAVLSAGLGPCAVFISSFINPKAYWETKWTDWACGAAAMIGLALWQTTSNQDYAIGFAILADFFAAVPTLRKAWRHPETENGKSYILYICNNILGLLCVRQPSFTGCAFLAWLAGLNTVFCLIIWRRQLLKSVWRN